MGKKKDRSPQEKKALTYAHDRRNAYRENDKASRKAIPARKAGESRKVRRKGHQELKSALRASEERAAVLESSLRKDMERVGGWKKKPDIPLRAYLQSPGRIRPG